MFITEVGEKELPLQSCSATVLPLMCLARVREDGRKALVLLSIVGGNLSVLSSSSCRCRARADDGGNPCVLDAMPTPFSTKFEATERGHRESM